MFSLLNQSEHTLFLQTAPMEDEDEAPILEEHLKWQGQSKIYAF